MIDLKRFASRHYRLLAIAGACALTFLIYTPGLSGPFVFDDYVNVIQNAKLDMQNLSLQSLADAAVSIRSGPLMRPVSMISFALTRYFYGDNAFAFKLVNLLIHLANGILIFLLLGMLLSAFRQLYAPTLASRRMTWLAIVVGSLWLVHPLNLTAVLYVVQRETSLSALFMLAGINLYVWARLRQMNGRRVHWSLFPGTILFGALAILSKESGALMPCYALAIEACLFQFRFTDNKERRTILTYFAVFLLLPGMLALFWIATHGRMLSYAGRDFTMPERLLTESRVIWLYIFWTLLPRIDNLSLYHDDILLSHSIVHPLTTLPALAGIVTVLAFAVVERRRFPLVALGIAWFFVGQLMESTIFPLQIAFEHRNYLADLGLLLAAMSLIFPMYENSRFLKLRYVFCGMLVVAFAGVTLQRAWNWRGPVSLALTEAHYHPLSPNATYQLGQLYANLILVQHHTDLLPVTRKVLLQSLQLPNSSIIPGTALVMTESQVGQPVSSSIYDRMTELLRTEHISSSDTIGLDSLVNCYTHNHCNLPPNILDQLFNAAFANPYVPESPGVAADLHVIYGNYLAGGKPRRLQEGREQMLQAAALSPYEPQYRINVVVIDLAMENADLANHDLQEVRKLNKFGLLDSDIKGLENNLARLVADQHAAAEKKTHLRDTKLHDEN